MKYLLVILLAGIGCIASAQVDPLKADESLLIPKLTIDAKGDLVIAPSSTSSASDFDFLVGKWKLKHKRLKSRLSHSNEWEEFETTVEDFGILEGMGNMDVGHGMADGKPWEGRTIRLFSEKTKLWSLYWMTSAGKMDPPVTGSFENGVGHFFCKDTFNGKKIIVLFRWDARDKEHSKWSQAFSADNGKTWEWNWFNVKERISSESLKTIVDKNSLQPLPKLNFDGNGEIVMTPSVTSSNKDFDFLIGKWKLEHRKLNSRLNNCTEWTEFENIVEDFPILEGMGNMDIGFATIDGKPWQGRTIRLFDPKTRLWSLYWVTNTSGVLDPPVVGSFENGVGHFFGKDTFNGKPIIMVFRWDARDKENPVWSQAFSADNGKTWEWNWTNVSRRTK
ncbi:MAG TPA: hypothetical protein VIT44_13040 [Cyclobacteriaceae bacterium]